jgi:hypothetical protein
MTMAKQQPYHQDDIAVWLDGAWAHLGETWNGGFGWRSDDYEIVRLEDVDRLRALGLADDFDLPPE